MPGLNSLHVLVVDDNPHMRSIVVAILRGVGIGIVKEASDGADAMEVMRAGVPDIVIVDLNMFPIDGLEFTQMIRTAVDSPFPFVPIIMMTGHTERTKVTAARDSGVNWWPSPSLRKPCSTASSPSSIALGRSSKRRPIPGHVVVEALAAKTMLASFVVSRTIKQRTHKLTNRKKKQHERGDPCRADCAKFPSSAENGWSSFAHADA